MISWQAPEYEYREKSPDWFWAVGIIAIAITVTSIVLDNILFAVFIVVGTFALLIYSMKKPRPVHFGITDKGVVVNNNIYPYNSLESFWVEEDANTSPKLLIKSQKVLMPYLIIPLADTDPEEVRDLLLDHLDEEEHREPVSQKVMEYLGF